LNSDVATNVRGYVWFRKDDSVPWTLSVSGYGGRLIGTVYEKKDLPASMPKRFIATYNNNGQAPTVMHYVDAIEEGRAWLEEQDALYGATSPATP